MVSGNSQMAAISGSRYAKAYIYILACMHDSNEILTAIPEVCRVQEHDGTNDNTIRCPD